MAGRTFRQEEAKKRILAERPKWLEKNPRENPTGRDAFSFYGDLLTHEQDLLCFRYPGGDRRQEVHGRLPNAGLVSD